MAEHDITLPIGVRRKRLIGYVLTLVACLAALNLAANIAWIERWPGSGTALALFSSDREMSIPTWWSSLMLAGLGGLAWLLSTRAAGTRSGDRLAWRVLAAVFVFLSIDEACMLHERIGGKVQWEGLMHHGRWIALWLPPAVVIGMLLAAKFWRSHRHLVVGLAVGAIIFLSGAVGVEMLNAANRYRAEQRLMAPPELVEDRQQSFVPLEWRRDRAYYPYVLGAGLEEFLEMLGPVVWLWVLLDPRHVAPKASASTHRAAALPPNTPPATAACRSAPG